MTLTEEVTTMTVVLRNRPDKGAKVEEFEIPRSFHKKVLAHFDNATPHRSQIDWAVLGELTITTASGVQKVLLFSAGDKMDRPRRR